MNLYSLLKGDITLQDLLNYYNASITYTHLPNKINGCVSCYKGIYSIYINELLSTYKKKKAILHELAHIELNQFCQCNNDLFAFKRDKYEDEADRYIKYLLDNTD